MIMPSDSPSSPGNYAGVAVSGFDIQAGQGDLSATFDAANSLAGAGVLYPQGPRQAETERLLSSPQGFGEFDVTAGYADGWPANVEPGG